MNKHTHPKVQGVTGNKGELGKRHLKGISPTRAEEDILLIRNPTVSIALPQKYLGAFI